ncbi:MAG: hypothetical protein NZ602_01825 [Thermoguttaceae bacterium]|nr:hypothetical protein [Thermoguttaceae bacterium]MDW8036805.1 hypothetical protein [Thermoguttaceae bacterium]
MPRILGTLGILLIIGAMEAWGQTGLYGAPEVIPFPPVGGAAGQGQVLPSVEPYGSAPVLGAAPKRIAAGGSGWLPMEPAGGGWQQGSQRYAQASVPYGGTARGWSPPAGGTASGSVEAPPAMGSASGIGYNGAGGGLPYVEPEAPTSLPSQPLWPGPEGGGRPQAGSPLGGSYPAATPLRADQTPQSGGKASASLVDQMLREGDQNATFGGVGTSDSPFAQALEDNASPPAGCCWGFLVPDCPWYVRLMVFMMGRDEPNRFWTSYETNNNPNQLMHTNDIGLAWRVGGEVRFGRRFGCSNNWAVEAAYWTLDPFDGRTAISHPNGVSTPINLQYVWFYRSATDWNMAADLFDNAIEHRLRRQDEFHNVEINFLRLHRLADPHFPLDLHWGLGARWLRFEEELLFGSLRTGSWGANGGRNEAYINQELTNDLIGVQLTVDMTYFVHRSWRIFLTPRVGLYNNHIDLDFQVYRGDGTAASPQPGSGVTGTYPVRAKTDTLSFLTQLDAGIEWHFAKHWTAAIGYRAIVATGMGLADHQFPDFLIDLPEIGHIDHNGHLILHGGFASLTVNF